MALNRWKSVALAVFGLVGTDAAGFAPAQAADQLRIAVQYGIGYLPFYVAEREGIFDKQLAAHGRNGVQVSLLRFNGGPAVYDAMLAGRVDMAVFGPSALIVIWDKTRRTSSEVIGVAGVTTMPPSMVTLRPEMTTLKDIGPNDRIAIAATVAPAAYVLRMAAERQLGKGNVFDQQIVAMPHPDALTALLSRKTEVTAIFVQPPYSDFAMRQPGAHRVLSSLDVFGGPSSSLVLGVSRRYADANPDIVKAVIAGLEDSNAIIVREPQRAADIYLSAEPSKLFSAPFVAELLTDDEHGFTTDVLGIMTYVDYLARNGQMKNHPADWNDLFLPYIHGRPGN
jgi:NitT/TauT family transport system substrate-binding protein